MTANNSTRSTHTDRAKLQLKRQSLRQLTTNDMKHVVAGCWSSPKQSGPVQ